MNSEFSNVPTAPKKNNTPLIIGAVVVLLLCCCCALIAGTLSVLGPTVNSVYESIQQEVPYQAPSGEDGDEENPITVPGLSDFVPTGGLGDDILRADTWANLNVAAAMASCTIPADGAGRTSISVIQNPDSAGTWVERWTVPCSEGGTKSFDITYTPAEGGGTDFSITLSD